MKALVFAFVVLWFCLVVGCGDDVPSRLDICTASCESRGGDFYLTDMEYCYCSFTKDGGVD